MKTLLLTLALSVLPLTAQDIPVATATDQHKWLQQLVGEWTVSAEMSMGPATEPMKAESTESCRALGDLWVVGEGRGNMMGQAYTSLMTLGYDPKQQAFIGTWVDTMQTHMWIYRGSLDEAKKTLTLEAEGPSFTDPNGKARYRDAITIVGPDHKVLTSSVLGEDGKWTTFLKADYRRKKADDGDKGGRKPQRP